jgi:hypothetical protein
VTVLALNLDRDRAAAVALPASPGARREVYRVTAPSLLAEGLLVNGVEATLDADSRLVLPSPETGPGDLVLPAASYAFVVLPDAGAAACAP